MKFRLIKEMIERERVVRGGNWKIKYVSTRDGYKIKNKDGTRTEVKMSYEEIRKRKKAAKRAAKKKKSQMGKINAKRKRSMAKRA